MLPFVILALLGGAYLLASSSGTAGGSGGGGGSGEHRGWTVATAQDIFDYMKAHMTLPPGMSASDPMPPPKPEVTAQLDALQKSVESGAKPKSPPYILKHDPSVPAMRILGVEGTVQSVSGSGAGRVWLVSFEKIVEQQSEMQPPPPELAAMGLTFPVPLPVKTKVPEPAIGSVFALGDSSFSIGMGK